MKKIFCLLILCVLCHSVCFAEAYRCVVKEKAGGEDATTIYVIEAYTDRTPEEVCSLYKSMESYPSCVSYARKSAQWYREGKAQNCQQFFVENYQKDGSECERKILTETQKEISDSCVSKDGSVSFSGGLF